MKVNLKIISGLGRVGQAASSSQVIMTGHPKVQWKLCTQL